jgi:PII-like signaling protein
VIDDALKLTTYFGERDRANGRFLADALLDLYGRKALLTSVLLRGTEGFGAGHRLQSQRLLTLSEDLPLVSVAVDARERVEALLPEVGELHAGAGLVTLERARLLDGAKAADAPGREAKLTVYCGRGEPFAAVVDVLRRHGVSGATVLLGVDGTAHGERRRARFLGGNRGVPLMIISVGAGDAIGRALPDLASRLERPLATLERIAVLRRDGRRLGDPGDIPDGALQKLMVYTSEAATVGGRSLYAELVRRLRAEGARGATALRGIWGYHGDHEPHGDKLLALRRHVPVVTVIVDEPARIRLWFEIVEDLTRDVGLVTGEMVPSPYELPQR